MKKFISLLIFLILLVSNAQAAIDVGSACADGAGSKSLDATVVDNNNAANATGTIDSVCIFANADIDELEFASFVHEGGNVLSTNGDTNGSNLTCTVAESPKTFTAPGDFSAFAVDIGDFIGCHGGVTPPTGRIEVDTTGGGGYWYVNTSDEIPCSSVTFTLLGSRRLALYATGTEAAAGNPQAIIISKKVN